mgnify:FL=1
MRRQLHQSLRDGLVGAWSPAAQGRSIGATGYTVPDLSGLGNHGTLTNMDAATDWVTTGGYPSLDFDGVNDHVPCGNVRVPFLGTYSISIWCYPRTWADFVCPMERGNTFLFGRHSLWTSTAGGF